MVVFSAVTLLADQHFSRGAPADVLASCILSLVQTMLDSAAVAIVVLIATVLLLKYLLSPGKKHKTPAPPAASPQPSTASPPAPAEAPASDQPAKVRLWPFVHRCNLGVQWMMTCRPRAHGCRRPGPMPRAPSAQNRPTPTPPIRSTRVPSRVRVSLGCACEVIVAGHTDEIHDLALVPNYKYYCSISSDRSVRLWRADEVLEKTPTYVRLNIEYDSASSIAWTPDSRCVMCGHVAMLMCQSIHCRACGQRPDPCVQVRQARGSRGPHLPRGVSVLLQCVRVSAPSAAVSTEC